MTTAEITAEIHQKQSFLCIGLDVDLEKIPAYLLEKKDPIFAFNKAIIKATHHLCVAYKLNTAFYESYGIKGWKSMKKTINYLNKNHPEIFTIADAKRGDIGNTSLKYAKAFFENLSFDSITVNPYMGQDSIAPFLTFKNKHTILLALTSNSGAHDFQTLQTENKAVYREVINRSKSWHNAHNLMYVVGATQTEHIRLIRELVPDSFLLIPGVGAQGGDLKEVCKQAINNKIGLLINSSRSIIYADSTIEFAKEASKKAKSLQGQMEIILSQMAKF